MKPLATIAFLCVLLQSVFAQCGDRYRTDVFPEIIIERDIQYGFNYDSKNNPTNLLMDVCQPKDDTAALRPLMIFVHGGSFIGGGRRDQRIDLTAEYFARKGYVTANIEYRLQQSTLIDPILDFAETDNWYQAIIRAVQDLNAVIRYFKKDAAENNNSYRVDTNTIILYGSSAGAITVLHKAFLTDADTAKANRPFQFNINKLGGSLYGNSGNQGYSVDGVKAVVSCSGALQDEKFFDESKKDIAYIAFHNNPDPVVPFDKGCFATAFCHLGYFYGANKLSKRAERLGMNYAFYPFEELGHPVDESSNTERKAFILETTKTFLADILCPQTSTPVRELSVKALTIYPNPSQGILNISLPEMLIGKYCLVEILDVSGRTVYSENVQAGSVLTVGKKFQTGAYQLKITSEILKNEVFMGRWVAM
jgi:hypothetical protein